jgi:hypothetical protein
VIDVLAATAGPISILAGLFLLRRSWLAQRRGRTLLLPAGWLCIIVGIALWIEVWGPEVGLAYGLLGLSTGAYALVFAGAEVRSGTRVIVVREPALEPEVRPTNWSRGIAKSLLAIVLSGIAAIGIGVAFAIAMPIGPQDRIMIGGLLVPILWGAGMAWTLSDPRLLRATVVLCSVSALGYGIAFLPKVLPQ